MKLKDQFRNEIAEPFKDVDGDQVHYIMEQYVDLGLLADEMGAVLTELREQKQSDSIDEECEELYCNLMDCIYFVGNPMCLIYHPNYEKQRSYKLHAILSMNLPGVLRMGNRKLNIVEDGNWFTMTVNFRYWRWGIDGYLYRVGERMNENGINYRVQVIDVMDEKVVAEKQSNNFPKAS